MADCKKCESHAGFFMVMALLAVAIAGAGYWWFTTNNVDAEKELTSQLNQPTHPPKDVKPKPSAAPAAPAASAGAATTDGK